MKIKKIPALLAAALLFLPQSAHGYTAKSGDTYFKIAKAHGTDLQSLLSANGKTDKSILNVGDTVLIPGIDVHIVKAGDTYWKIAKYYGISFKELLKINGADENSWLSVGQVIKLNGAENSDPYITYETYYIKAGDTLWSLSQKFGVPYAELCAANKTVDSLNLYSGLRITVPVHHIPETAHKDGCGEYL